MRTSFTTRSILPCFLLAASFIACVEDAPLELASSESAAYAICALEDEPCDFAAPCCAGLSCEWDWVSLAGTCAPLPGSTSCSKAGGACNDGTSSCCVLLTCVVPAEGGVGTCGQEMCSGVGFLCGEGEFTNEYGHCCDGLICVAPVTGIGLCAVPVETDGGSPDTGYPICAGNGDYCSVLSAPCCAGSVCYLDGAAGWCVPVIPDAGVADAGSNDAGADPDAGTFEDNLFKISIPFEWPSLPLELPPAPGMTCIPSGEYCGPYSSRACCSGLYCKLEGWWEMGHCSDGGP